MVIVIGQRGNRVRSRDVDRGRDIVSIRGRDVAGVGIRVMAMCGVRIATEVLDTGRINILGWGKDTGRMNIWGWGNVRAGVWAMIRDWVMFQV